MGAVPLQADMGNKAAYVNSLFLPVIRDPSQNALLASIRAGHLAYAYTDAHSAGLVLGAWLAAWQDAEGAPCDPQALARCPHQDRQVIGFLAGYLATTGLDLCLPQLAFSSLNAKGWAIYRNAGYQRLPFKHAGTWCFGAFDANGNVIGTPWASVVAVFLQLLFMGAHIVAISSTKDVGQGTQDLLDDLKASGLALATDAYSSHYGGAAAASGRYYAPAGAPSPLLGADRETLATTSPPGQEPLALALLVGVTAVTHRNCFLQLEGWPSQYALQPPGGQRHNADYAANESTFWNFSTFGACAYSEKRSTPVFLAGSQFDLTIHQDTGMPWYWGANAGNAGDAWMHPELVIATT